MLDMKTTKLMMSSLDNRDPDVTWVWTESGHLLEITRSECEELIRNMDENVAEEG